MHILKRTLKWAQLQLSQPLLFYISKRKDKQKLIRKCLMAPYCLRNIVQNGPKTPKNVQSSRSSYKYFSLAPSREIRAA